MPSYIPLSSTPLSLPKDTYIYTLVPLPSSHSSPSSPPTNLAALASDNSVRIFPLSSSSAGALPQTPTVTLANVHEGGGTCLKALNDVDGANMLVTAGRDGAVRCWDWRVGGRKAGMEFWGAGGGE